MNRTMNPAEPACDTQTMLSVDDKREARERLVALLRGDLVGPLGEDMEELPERPDKR